MTPVSASSASPGGREPEVTLNELRASPLAVYVNEYGWPTTPPGAVAPVTCGGVPPNCPESPLPQHAMLPSAFVPQPCTSPLDSPRRPGGGGESRGFPQQAVVPSSFTPHPKRPPRSI